MSKYKNSTVAKFNNRKAEDHNLFTKSLYAQYKKLLPKTYKRDHSKNLMNLQTPFHGNHPIYTRYVEKRFLQMVDQGPISMDKMRSLQDSLRTGIEKIQNSGKYLRLNDFFKKNGY
jgi:uncharacterized NAD(P)/FAD-binding protein YdhS